MPAVPRAAAQALQRGGRGLQGWRLLPDRLAQCRQCGVGVFGRGIERGVLLRVVGFRLLGFRLLGGVLERIVIVGVGDGRLGLQLSIRLRLISSPGPDRGALSPPAGRALGLSTAPVDRRVRARRRP